MMKAAGVRIALYHPYRLSDLALLNNRTHRKLAIFDGHVAYVFGHGIADLLEPGADDRLGALLLVGNADVDHAQNPTSRSISARMLAGDGKAASISLG